MNVSLRGVENEGRRHAAEQGQAVAWVESPLQLLCVVEAHHAGLLGSVTTVVPRAGLPALRLTRRELERLGLPEGLEFAEPAERVPRPGRTWAVGDAFSGRVQLALVTALSGRTVLVDDGLATIRLLELLVARRPLLRARGAPGVVRKVLAAAAGFRLRTRRPTVFTALPVPAGLAEAVEGTGARLVRHDFAWLRAQPAVRPPQERTVVLGTSLVRNGLIHRDRYLRWLERIDEPVAYFPHRREDPEDLDRVRRIAGLTVYDAGAPAEMTLRDLRPDQRVLSLPSTAVTSLRVLLSARGVRVEAVDVPEDWWTASAVPSLRSHLQLFAHEPHQPHTHDPGKVAP
ncbi:hypothetical protein [Microbispora bryophytorum]|uniref:Uncharacterized protein n=1 Tax=Microbispora bryophytorum subsp. camponoti TaxID=1677852 RepID=A0ABR8L711_9ACTN|nr:hypothetical protein [Microbispora camponoti]MBD3146705.1 hypothetical protein [Microbispora camponoti]